jgi:hypothetical protein
MVRILDLKDSYNFVVRSIKVTIKQNFEHIFSPKEHGYSSKQLKPLLPSGTWMLPRQFKLLFLKDMIISQGKKDLSCSLRQLNLPFPKDMIIPQGKKDLSCSLRQLFPQGHDSSLGKNVAMF